MIKGICDKSKTLEETIKEEILEECGYQVDVDKIYKIKCFRTGVGLFGGISLIVIISKIFFILIQLIC